MDRVGDSKNVGMMIIVFIIAVIVMAWLVQITWNYTLPDLFGIRQIGFWQAIALLILLNILLGSVGSMCVTAYR